MFACLNAGLLARNHLHPTGPATGHLDYGFSDFHFVLQQILSLYTKSVFLRMRSPKTNSIFFAKTQSSQRDQKFFIILLAKNENSKKKKR